MKKLLLLAVVAIGSAVPGATRTEMIREKLLSDDRNYVFVAMHRGDWRNFPENSKDAILSCIALGADIVELDAQMTKDGHFVLLHDGSLNRTTTGQGKVKDLTLAEVKQFKLKSNQGGKDGIGGIAGYGGDKNSTYQNSITNCYNTGTITNSGTAFLIAEIARCTGLLISQALDPISSLYFGRPKTSTEGIPKSAICLAISTALSTER